MKSYRIARTALLLAFTGACALDAEPIDDDAIVDAGSLELRVVEAGGGLTVDAYAGPEWVGALAWTVDSLPRLRLPGGIEEALELGTVPSEHVARLALTTVLTTPAPEEAGPLEATGELGVAREAISSNTRRYRNHSTRRCLERSGTTVVGKSCVAGRSAQAIQEINTPSCLYSYWINHRYYCVIPGVSQLRFSGTNSCIEGTDGSAPVLRTCAVNLADIDTRDEFLAYPWTDSKRAAVSRQNWRVDGAFVHSGSHYVYDTSSVRVRTLTAPDNNTEAKWTALSP